MLHKTWEREESYRRRLAIVVPVAALLVLGLFVTSDYVSVEEIEKQVGWKGALKVMPEISIVFDQDDVVMPEQQRKLTTTKTIDIDLPDGTDIAEPVLQQVERPVEETIDWAEWDNFQARTIKSARDVPYSEDYVLLKMIEPKYPPDEQRSGVEGNVLVELFVNEAGKVETVNVLNWLGPQSFRDSTVSAVKRFEFQPPIVSGEPSSIWVRFMVRFRLFG